ncbi:MAG TPA: 50S ribosomal protein L4 [Candidatus Saccharimonadales bacterium]|nr:50S ribosomal protein L4 [Candidatus Saccharimonadales bacterium]
MAGSTAPAFTKSGAKATTATKLDKAVFAVVPQNHELLKLAYTAYLANGRDNLAQTKTRGLVSGGGKKPWKQKGTGRARFGSTRNPIWRGGGIVFGPTGEENYSVKVNVAAKRQALRQALSLAASENRIKVIETIESKDGKVAPVVKMLAKLEANGNVLLVADHKDDLAVRATRNLQGVKIVQATYLNVYDVLNADTIVLSEKSLAIVTEWLGDKNND